jgi:hypothetical protein
LPQAAGIVENAGMSPWSCRRDRAGFRQDARDARSVMLRGRSRLVQDAAGALALAAALVAFAPGAHAQVYKCTDAAGKVSYADTPCDNRARPLKLADDVKATPTDPNLCAQLLDETNRLAAEAQRGSQRGRAESAGSARRRTALDQQYAARCAGIARANPASR